MTKPVLEETYRLVSRWNCGVSDHWHHAEGVAQRCIEDQAKRRLSQEKRKRIDGHSRKRSLRLARDYLGGMTLEAVGAKAGISRERVRQVVIAVLARSDRPRFGPRENRSFDWPSMKAILERKDYWLKRLLAYEEYWDKRA